MYKPNTWPQQGFTERFARGQDRVKWAPHSLISRTQITALWWPCGLRLGSLAKGVVTALQSVSHSKDSVRTWLWIPPWSLRSTERKPLDSMRECITLRNSRACDRCKYLLQRLTWLNIKHLLAKESEFIKTVSPDCLPSLSHVQFCNIQVTDIWSPWYYASVPAQCMCINCVHVILCIPIHTDRHAAHCVREKGNSHYLGFLPG